MREFKDKVAVVTGGGSGIGEGFVRRCVAERMKVVIADINQKNLDRVKTELKSSIGSDRLLAIKIDVGKKEDILLLAEMVKEKFGRIDLLFNHAGMPGPVGPIWKASFDEIEKVVRVNLLSIMYSLRAFVPTMIAQNTPGHIVNTSSGAGLKIGYNMAGYITTKHAVVALSETLSLDLDAAKSKIKASVLCPGMVATDFAKMVPDVKTSDNDSVKELKKYFTDKIPKGIPVEQVIAQTFDAIMNEKFYILTHYEEHRDRIREITENMLSGKNPIDLFKE